MRGGKRPGAGRPKSGNPRMRPLTVMLDERSRDDLRFLEEMLGESKGAIVRRALAEIRGRLREP